MIISLFDLFTIGIGPSSSHTVGPMRAARLFARALRKGALLPEVRELRVELYGSLALTGKGHGTDRAILLGLEGETPEDIDPGTIGPRVEAIRSSGELRLAGEHVIHFAEKHHLLFHRKRLPLHSNGMQFTALDAGGRELHQACYYSVGGGFVADERAMEGTAPGADGGPGMPHPFRSAADLLSIHERTGFSFAGIVLENEKVRRSGEEVLEGLDRIWAAMQECVQRGCSNEGELPGGLRVQRRAPGIYRELTSHPEHALRDPLTVMDWVNLYALAVNEENAAGGRVVTAPTNGAAGVMPAVLHYYDRFCPGARAEGVREFLLTAAAIAILYKLNASLSGAEVGCQGEVGVACSMAAGGLTAALGGTMGQVENAAEIAMEHNLGLTCDPVGGLVQIPCIERNAMGAVKAINASRMALRGDGQHYVSLDKVIDTMRQTGADMQTKYKETSRGGLAVNVVEC